MMPERSETTGNFLPNTKVLTKEEMEKDKAMIEKWMKKNKIKVYNSKGVLINGRKGTK